MPRTTVGAKTQHAALAIAARCNRRCRAMRWPMHRTASHRPATQGAAGGTLCGTGERARGESVRARRGGAQGRTPGMLQQEALPHGRQGIRKKTLARKHHEGCQARENGAKARSQGSGVACRWGQGHLRSRLLAGCFQRTPTGKGGIPDALPERAAVISEGKRGLQSMYVGCQL